MSKLPLVQAACDAAVAVFFMESIASNVLSVLVLFDAIS